VLDRAAIGWFFDQYMPSRAEREDWRFAPLLAPDVDGVAPAWIGLAECDPLVDEGVDYADKLRAAGVAVDLEIYRGVTHEFIKMGRAIPEARAPTRTRRARCAPPLASTEAKPMQRQDFRCFHRLRVRWAEVDMQKIVFNATT
jgi:acetyl esterase/lipase